MRFKTISAAAGVAAMLALAVTAPARAAVTLFVNFSDDANGSLQSSTGDQFNLLGLSGGVLLSDGLAQDVDVLDVEQTLAASWDDATYSEIVGHTLTLNGVDGIFFSPWDVFDHVGPSSDVGGDGPIVYHVAGGTITVSMNAGSTAPRASDGSQGHFSANMLFQAGGAAPEPATWALMVTGVAGAGFALRRARRASATAA